MEVPLNWEFYKHLRDSSEAAAVPSSHHLPLDLSGHKLPSTGLGTDDSDGARQYKEPFEDVFTTRQVEDNSDNSSCSSSLPDLMRDYTEIDNGRRNCFSSLSVLSKESIAGDSELRNGPFSLLVLPKDITKCNGENSTSLPSHSEPQREGNSEQSNHFSSQSALPMNFTDGNSEKGDSSSLPVLQSIVEGSSEQENGPTSLPALPGHDHDQINGFSTSPMLHRDLREKNGEAVNSCLSLSLFPSSLKENPKARTNEPNSTSLQPESPRHPILDNSEESNCPPSLSVLSSSLMVGNNDQTNSSSSPSSPQHPGQVDGEHDNSQPSLSVLSSSLMENSSGQTNCRLPLPVLTSSSTEDSSEQNKSRPSLTVLSSSLMENYSDRRSCPSPLPGASWHITEDTTDQRNISSPPPSLPSPSLPSTSHLTPHSQPPPPSPPSTSHLAPASQNVVFQASEPQTPEASCSQSKKRKRIENDNKGNSEVNMPWENTGPPPYSYCIASAVENILLCCPEDTRRECGQLILSSAVKILMEMKKESSVSLAE